MKTTTTKHKKARTVIELLSSICISPNKTSSFLPSEKQSLFRCLQLRIFYDENHAMFSFTINFSPRMTLVKHKWWTVISANFYYFNQLCILDSKFLNAHFLQDKLHDFLLTNLPQFEGLSS